MTGLHYRGVPLAARNIHDTRVGAAGMCVQLIHAPGGSALNQDSSARTDTGARASSLASANAARCTLLPMTLANAVWRTAGASARRAPRGATNIQHLGRAAVLLRRSNLLALRQLHHFVA